MVHRPERQHGLPAVAAASDGRRFALSEYTEAWPPLRRYIIPINGHRWWSIGLCTCRPLIHYPACVQDAVRPYNPLDRVELGKSVERALLTQPLVELPPTARFPGAGLYAIYYIGSLDYYAPIAPPTRSPGEIPIYVGRARPKGARQGGSGLEATTSEPVLFDRLREHAKSITQAERYAEECGLPGLRLADFLCRYLVADDIWVPLGEALLIAHYRPVWNAVVDGFGNHQPGGGREKQARSAWDELHPGRPWALRLAPNKRSAAEIREDIAAHLATVSRPNLDETPVIDERAQQALFD